MDRSGTGGNNTIEFVNSGGTAADALRYYSGLETDLSGASAATVSQLREAMALQRFQEIRSRYGSRFSEYLRYLGVKSSDARFPVTIQATKITQTIARAINTSL